MTAEILYLFGFSPRINNRLEKLVKVIRHQLEAKQSVAIALIHDAVVGAGPDGKVPICILDLLKMGVEVYALGPDLDARGISSKPLQEGIVRIDYDELMTMVVATKTLCSWL
jgi:sulfur relay protein TusB/DsrH